MSVHCPYCGQVKTYGHDNTCNGKIAIRDPVTEKLIEVRSVNGIFRPKDEAGRAAMEANLEGKNATTNV